MISFVRSWVTFGKYSRGKGASPTNQCWCQKIRMIALLCGIKISVMHHLLLSQYTQTDGQTELQQQYCALHYMRLHGKNELSMTVFSIIPWPISAASTSFIWFLVSSSSPTPTHFHHHCVITCTECVFSFFQLKNKLSRVTRTIHSVFPWPSTNYLTFPDQINLLILITFQLSANPVKAQSLSPLKAWSCLWNRLKAWSHPLPKGIEFSCSHSLIEAL